jgi:hypothetical protein
MLPCPECSEHATKYISNIKPGILKTKYDMANMLCHFHNSVNFRKRLPYFNPSLLSNYEKVSIVSAFNNFVKAFTLPTQRQMNENLHRKMMASHLQTFISTNLIYFMKPNISTLPSSPPSPLVNTASTADQCASFDNQSGYQSITSETKVDEKSVKDGDSLPNKISITYDIIVDEILVEEMTNADKTNELSLPELTENKTIF